MNIKAILWTIAHAEKKRGLPILSFPAVQKLGITVEEMLKSAERQAQVMALIAAETDTIAAVSPMDLSIEAEAFGAEVHFSANEVPVVVGQCITDEDDAAALAVPDLTVGRAPVSIEGVRLAKQRIKDKPVLAGMIGPFSLAGRLLDVTEIMYACYDEPQMVHTVLEKATEYLTRYAHAMKEAGADGIVMAEPLAGILSPELVEAFSTPYVTRIIADVQNDAFSLIYHNCGNAVSQMLEQIFAQGAAAYHFGNAVDMHAILEAAPADVFCMGNIDPVSQFADGTPESVSAATRLLMKACGAYPNFIPSSGCDIPAHASWDNICAFFDALRMS